MKKILITRNEENAEYVDIELTVSFKQCRLDQKQLENYLRVHKDAEVTDLSDVEWPEPELVKVCKSLARLPKVLDNMCIQTKYEIRE